LDLNEEREPPLDERGEAKKRTAIYA